MYPRIVGILLDDAQSMSSTQIKYLVGDATEPQTADPTVIAHIVNDKAPSWGAGFGKALAVKWPEAQKSFRQWAQVDKSHLQLGNSHSTKLSDNLYAFHMVAQRGYLPRPHPLIRYQALDSCLKSLAKFAGEHSARIQMPLIGTGHAGGNWLLIEELVRERLTAVGLEVTVLTLPGDARPTVNRPGSVGSPQLTLLLGEQST